MNSTLTDDIVLLKELVNSLLSQISALEKENVFLRSRLSSVEQENKEIDQKTQKAETYSIV